MIKVVNPGWQNLARHADRVMQLHAGNHFKHNWSDHEHFILCNGINMQINGDVGVWGGAGGEPSYWLVIFSTLSLRPVASRMVYCSPSANSRACASSTALYISQDQEVELNTVTLLNDVDEGGGRFMIAL